MVKIYIFALLFLVGTVQSQNFNVTMTCQACSVTCTFANCYRVTTTNYDRQVCGTSSCVLGNTFNTTITTCLSRYVDPDTITTTIDQNTFFKCNTGLCYQIPNMSKCSNNPQCLTDITAYTLNCVACSTVGVSSCIHNCQLYQYSVSNKQIRCPAGQCLYGQSLVRKYGPCASGVDSFGNICSCCQKSTFTMNVTGNSSKVLGYCTSDIPAISTPQFTTYGLARIANQSNSNTTSKNEKYLVITTVIILIITILI